MDEVEDEMLRRDLLEEVSTGHARVRRNAPGTLARAHGLCAQECGGGVDCVCRPAGSRSSRHEPDLTLKRPFTQVAGIIIDSGPCRVDNKLAARWSKCGTVGEDTHGKREANTHTRSTLPPTSRFPLVCSPAMA